MYLDGLQSGLFRARLRIAACELFQPERGSWGSSRDGPRLASTEEPPSTLRPVVAAAEPSWVARAAHGTTGAVLFVAARGCRPDGDEPGFSRVEAAGFEPGR